MGIKQRINIATSLNSKYMRYAYVMLTSFFENLSKDMEGHIYLLYSDLTTEDKEKLESLVKSYSGILHLFLVGKEIFTDFRTTADWSSEAYYRLILVNILPEDVERILYLDVDVIVNKSLNKLYFTDFGENVICACKDICEAPFGDERDTIFEEQIQNSFTYFCSGVLLLNVKKMREKYELRNYLDLAQQLEHKMVAPDQDILNYMHWKEVKLVDAGQYNLFAWIAYTNNIHYPEVKESASIVHFSGPKPWAGKYIHYDIEQLWWDYARKTPFYYEFLEECVYGAVHDPMIYLQNASLRMEIQSLSEGLTEATALCEKLYNIVRSREDNKLHVKEERGNDKKIAFIICADNSLYYDECVWYINNLHIPFGYEIDIICIMEAESMAQGYNAAMKDSDAKYKVYLHQDVFIYNRYFIDDMLEVFHADSQIGLAGVIGGIDLPQNAIIWNAWNVGRTYGCNYAAAFPVNGYQREGSKWIEVEAVDGMLMATQHDVEWREDLTLGWDFYDISQSLEFRRQGYKVVVPFQKEPWCMHDCGNSKLLHYDEDRERILKEYKDFFSEEFLPEYDLGVFCQQKKIFEALRMCLQQRMFDKALEICTKIPDESTMDKEIQYAINMLEIYLAEQSLENGVKSFFSGICTWEEMRDKYDEIKFAVRHVENKTNEEAIQALLYKIENKELSWQAVQIISEHSTVNKEHVISFIERTLHPSALLL